jgi:hypothetical protein
VNDSTRPSAGAARPLDLDLANRLAAQRDGVLDDSTEFLDGLSDDDLALVADIARTERELREEDEAAGVLPLRRPPPADARPARRGTGWRWLAAAAVIAAVAVSPLLWRAAQGGAVRAPSQAVALLADRGAGLPAGMEEGRWPVTRGAEDALSETARAARLGALSVDLEMAIRAGDGERRRLLAAQARAQMDVVSPLAGGGFGELAASESADAGALLALLRRATETASGFVDGERVALGAWTEAARLAAARRDEAFFRAAGSRRTLEDAARILAGDAAALAQVEAVRGALRPDPPSWDELRAAVDALLYAIA